MGDRVMKNSCESCRQRKIRCDKVNPCIACVRSGTQCVFVDRPRVSRGFKGGRRKESQEWKSKLAQLESLVETLQTKALSQPNLTTEAIPSRNESINTPAQTVNPRADDGLNRYLGASVWSALSEQVEGLREALSSPSDYEDDDDDPDESSQASYSRKNPEFDFVLCNGMKLLVASPESLQHPPSKTRQFLASIYMSNVDSIFKILHAPTLRGSIEAVDSHAHYQFDDSPTNALLFSVYYAAITTQKESECRNSFGAEKEVLLDKYRFATEVYLSKADLPSCTDLTTLQAFVIYLLILRTHDNGQRAWSLMGLAVQLARGMGLHLASNTGSFKPFETEIRRRLWHQLCVLDFRAAVDRGAEFVISRDSYDTPTPLNITDDDLSGASTGGPLVQQKGITEMTFSILCQESAVLVKRLNENPVHERDSADGASIMTDQDWNRRHDLAVAFKNRIEQVTPYCDLTIPLHCFLKFVMEGIVTIAMLSVWRPLWRKAYVVPPATQDYRILELAIEALQKDVHLTHTAVTDRFQWYLWVQWYVLAVALAELCGLPDSHYVTMAWKTVEKAFEQQSHHIADSKNGRLWQPIKRLMKKAQSMRRTERVSLETNKPFISMADTDATAPVNEPLQTLAISSADADETMFMNEQPSWAEGMFDTSGSQAQMSGYTEDFAGRGMELSWDCWEGFLSDFTEMDASTFFPDISSGANL